LAFKWGFFLLKYSQTLFSTFFLLAFFPHFLTILIRWSRILYHEILKMILFTSFIAQISNWTILFQFFWILFYFWQLFARSAPYFAYKTKELGRYHGLPSL
jgi:hypothetical protein